MSLRDLSPGYRHAAALLKVRLWELRIKIKQQTDPDELCKLKFDYLKCTQMYRECKDLAELTEHYYERSYYRDKHYTL